MMKVLYFEDFEVGDKKTYSTEYEVTKEDIIEFATKWDPLPFHIDEEAAKTSPFKSLIASGSHILAIRTWLMHRLEEQPDTIAQLGWDELRLPNPVRPGDKLSLTIETVMKRESKSKQDCGICTGRFIMTNQDGLPVLECLDTILVAKRNT